MKLLFDQNLSPRLIDLLSDRYPDSTHVRNVGLATAPDVEVWNYAANHGFTIVSKDSDFHQRCFLFGHPPKVVWVRLGNCSTDEVANLLRARHSDVIAFQAVEQGSFLALK